MPEEPWLAGLRVVTIALNLPGPVACARLRELGASVAKVEPPAGDPFAQYCPRWYEELHAGTPVERLDLKAAPDRARMAALLDDADLLVSAQRPAALGRLGLDAATLARQHPRLCHVNITGHAAPHEDAPGHDLTYLAPHGLLAPPDLPPTLFADMAGAERAVSTALALVAARARSGRGVHAACALEAAAATLARPRREGLTGPGTLLGGALPGYNLYAARDGWLALAALEPHFARRLSQAAALDPLTTDGLRAFFMRHELAHWEAWARAHDLPLAAVRNPSTKDTHHADQQ